MEDVFVQFRQITNEITRQYGGNMSAFVIMATNPNEALNTQEFKLHGGGLPQLQRNLIIEAAAGLVRGHVRDTNANRSEAMAVLMGAILDRVISMDKFERDRRGPTTEHPKPEQAQ